MRLHDDGQRRVAVFVSPHGFGHAARAAAVMEAMRRADSAVVFEVFTTVPPWFFADCPGTGCRVHPLVADVGLVQRDALDEDLEATVARLGRVLPPDPAAVRALAELLRSLRVELVVADISPLGLAVAAAAGVPSVLVENFTWDFIYRGYLDLEPRLERFAAACEHLSASATLHVRTRPTCGAAHGDLDVAPVSRRPRRRRDEVRAALGMDRGVPGVLVTMGGIPWRFECLDALAQRRDAVFVVPGGSDRAEARGNLRLLPHRSEHYHPDLVHACDAVIGKLGYSTVAEAWAAGVPFAGVARDRFPESPELAAFVAAEMGGFAILPAEVRAGRLADHVDRLLALPRVAPRRDGGAAAVAAAALEMIATSCRAPASVDTGHVGR